MPIEPSVNWFSDYDINQPQDGDDLVEGDNHIRNLKKSILAQFPSLGDVAMTATAVELNALDLTTGAGTAEADKALVLDSSSDIAGINSLTATLLVTDNLARLNAGDMAIWADAGNVVIEGMTFNGTVLTGATSITSTTFIGALTGNADTATAWATARQLVASGGDVTGTSTAFDGTGNPTINLQIAANAVGSNEIAANAVSFASEVATATANVSFVSATGTDTFVIPKGVYVFGSKVSSTGTGFIDLFLEVFNGYNWIAVDTDVTVFSDAAGTNHFDNNKLIVGDNSSTRFRMARTSGSGSLTVRARKLY